MALPRKPFVGHPMVLMILNDALRQQVRKTAMVIVRDDEKRNTILDAVRTAGYEVIQVDVPGDAIGQALAAPAVDVVFVGAGTSPDSAIGSFRRETVFQYLPVVIHQAGPAASRLAEQDGRVVVLASDQDNAESIGKALEQAISLTAGAPLDEQQARQWTLRAARAVQAVAECESIVYDVKRSVDALISVLQRDDSELVAAAAGALANIRSARAQQALIDLALRAETPLDTRVMAFNAASQSVRRFGNEATNAQAQAVVQTVTGEGENDLLNAAARLLGTMNLPSEQTPELILGADEMD
jgi:hypothetical protein